MADNEVEILSQPFQAERLVQVRTGKTKPVFGLPVLSAIFKTPKKGLLKVTKLGLEGDQQAFEFHGGFDKALLQYCSRHYASWRVELPQSSHLFTTGGFGENLVGNIANERNVCIGDVISIGFEVVLQVSLPRQPCFKLNHRFEVKDMSRRSQTLARTGWYYRVLKEGYICEGDEIRLVERINPAWTVAKVQHYLYIEIDNEEVMKELVNIEGLGAESRTIFQNRLNKQYENQELRLGESGNMALKTWAQYKIVSKKMETLRILSFRFEALETVDNPKKAEPGSHVRIKLGKLTRAYSIVGGDANCLELGIALDAQSRGGSKFLHESTKEGDILQLETISNTFPLAPKADHHVMIAGGIGITAFIAAALYLDSGKQSFELHFAVRSKNDIPFKHYLEPLIEKGSVRIHDKAAGQSINLKELLNQNNENSHIYCCGPQRLMDGVVQAAEACGVPKDHVHFEAFSGATGGDPFTAEVASSKRVVEVGENSSLLDVLRAAGIEVDSSCEAGNCGACRVVVKCGRIEHRGNALLESERGNSSAMLSCVSRGIGHIVLDL